MPMQEVVDFIIANKDKRFALTGHPRPDGDAIGSVVGLCEILKNAGYDARAVNLFPIPERLSFLIEPSSVLPLPPEWVNDFDCFIVMDCGDWPRLHEINQVAKGSKLRIATIDHHASSQGIGEAVWIQPDASSVGEMVVNLALAAGWEIPAAAAEALWVAIVTDTGRFSYENTSPQALAAARECLVLGAKPARVAEFVYQSVTRQERALQSRALSRMQYFEDGKIAVTWLVHQDFIDADCGIEGAQDMINLLRDTAGVEVALFLCEIITYTGDVLPGAKASVRTAEPYDAIKLVAGYGGGGHHRAAGCTIDLPIDTAKRHFVEAARKIFFNRATSSSVRI